MSLFGLRRSGPIEWPDLLTLLRTGSFAAVVEALRDLDEPQRVVLGKQLVMLRRDTGSWASPQEATAYAVAAVGCASTAAKAVAVITRHGWLWSAIQPQPVVRAAADRGVPWLGEVATRLADKLPRDGASLPPWRFTADLLSAAGAPIPTGERFVDGWLLSLRLSGWDTAVLERLSGNPLTDALLPAAFERDGIAATTGHHDPVTREWIAGPGILLAVAKLVEDGQLPRASTLDRCLDALLAARPAAVLHAFVRFHEALAPSESEVAERATIYLKLLTDAMGSVATMAQSVLKPAEAAGVVELESLLDASRTVLTRSEKGLVRAQLIWLEKLAKRLPARAAEIAEVIAVAAEHSDVQVRDRSAALLSKLGAPVVASVHVASPEPDLLTAPATAAAMPDPIASPDELAEEIAVLDQSDWETPPFERVLAALVRMHAADPVELRAAIAPVMQRVGNRIGNTWWSGESYRHAGALLTTALTKAAGLPFILDDATRILRGTPADARVGNSYCKLHGVLMLRLAEIVVRLSTEPVPALVATPTQVNGLLDPVALVERLARAEREGWQPWKRDLRQALYRLPAGTDADALRQARTLRSEAGRTLAEWLEAGGVGRPEVQVVRVHRQRAERGRNVDWLPESRFYAASTPDRCGLDPYLLTDLTPPPVLNADHGLLGWAALWPAVLPSQREVVAACVLPLIAASADLAGQRGDARLLPLLAELTGPIGPATRTAVAYGLAASQPAERIAALDALLSLAAHGPVPTAYPVASSVVASSVVASSVVASAAGVSDVASSGVAAGATSPGLASSVVAGSSGAAIGGAGGGDVLIGSGAIDDSGTAVVAGDSGGGFDGAEVGAQLARMAGTKLIVLSRAVTQLEDAARIAPAMTWQIAAGALAGLLPAEHTNRASGSATTPASRGASTGDRGASGGGGGDRGASGGGGGDRRASARGGGASTGGQGGADGGRRAAGRPPHVTPRGLPDLMTLASSAAAASGSRGDVPGLAELAARSGSTRLVVEAKRLHRTLTAD